MIDITINVSATLLIPIPNSVSTDTATYEIFDSSATLLASGSLTFVRDEIWKATYTPVASGVIAFKGNDTTISSKRENFYNVVSATTTNEDEQTTIPLNIATDLLIPIPGSSSTDLVTYEIFDASGTVLDSGTMDFVRDEIWKVSDFTGDDTGLIVLKANDTTLTSKRENFYNISSGFLGVLSIVNIALRHLGMGDISSLDEDTPSSRAVVKYFTLARNATLASHRWSFATVVDPLVLVTTVTNDDHPDWTVFYEYPDNALAVWNVYNSATVGRLTFPHNFTNNFLGNKEDQDFEVRYVPSLAAKVICCDLESAFVEYTYKVTDTTIWDNRFIEAFTYKLAAMMAHDLIGDPTIGLKLMATFNALISEAKRLDFSQKRKRPDQTSGYVSSRG